MIVRRVLIQRALRLGFLVGLAPFLIGCGPEGVGSIPFDNEAAAKAKLQGPPQPKRKQKKSVGAPR